MKPGNATRVVRTPARLWFGPYRQIRYAMERDSEGRLTLRLSAWSGKLDGWHADTGIWIARWAELFAVVGALIRSFAAMVFSKTARGR